MRGVFEWVKKLPTQFWILFVSFSAICTVFGTDVFKVTTASLIWLDTVTSWIATNPFATLLALLGFVIASIATLVRLYFVVRARNKASLGGDVVYKNRESKNYKDDFATALANAKTVLAIGISNDRLTANATAEIYAVILSRRLASVQILFAHPDGEGVAMREQDESRPTGALATRIRHSVQDLEGMMEQLKLRHPKVTSQINHRFYGHYPMYSCVIIDEDVLFLHLYHYGHRGNTNPAFLFRSSNSELVSFYIKEFEAAWVTASPVMGVKPLSAISTEGRGAVAEMTGPKETLT